MIFNNKLDLFWTRTLFLCNCDVDLAFSQVNSFIQKQVSYNEQNFAKVTLTEVVHG